ncbi:glycerate kinase [Bordetella genomosp. 10]|uniref:Glycerate kinase n=1 Tax=Bordetella genomosp. 10 TaxID=1416804 RepID=A0A261S2D3_9BORD|nr:DUF4147 domain-containing protein [Bordetella genomosp. 10]OZI31147.1 glycerate kinase [Bordetella genomosp. 10]
MNLVKNRDTLTAMGQKALRTAALNIAEKGIEGAHPGLATRRITRIEGDYLHIQDRAYDLRQGRVFVIGAGKASFPIAKALEDVLGDRLHKGIVICKHGQEGRFERIRMILASHPLPDENSLRGAQLTQKLLDEVRPGDIVIACFTGGSSSLFVHPAADIEVADKIAASQTLLTCGANIVEINDVRKHLSKVKGGRLLRNLPRGAHVINLTVSDVIDDPLDYITDPTFPDRSTFADARAVLSKYELWSRMPASVARHLREGRDEDETARDSELAHIDRYDILLLKTDAACSAAVQAASELGFKPLLLSTVFEGDSGMLGRNFVAIAKQIMLDGNPSPAPCALIGGGETTVITGSAKGLGGPNQEFSVAAALDLAGHPGIVVLGIDTDGTDGPTQFAGGLADSDTLHIARERNIDLDRALREHNVSPALQAIEHHIITGNTGTNVNDLKLALILPPEPSRPQRA